MPKMQIPSKLLPLIQKKKRYKVIIGGRGSGKSQTVADIALMDMQTKGMKIGFFREFQNSINDSVYSLLCDEIERLELTGFDIQASEINTDSGAKGVFKGLARNPESIKSMNGFERFIVEESQTISEKSLKLLTPTLRTDESEIWFIANPQSSADPFSKRFIIPFQAELEKNGYYEDDLHLIIVCNYTDNPFFPDVLEQERLHDYENLSRAEYDHIWLGKFNDEVENSIIKAEYFDAAIDAHKLERLKEAFKPHGAVICAHDPFNGGNDAGGFATRHGSIITSVKDINKVDIDECFDWAAAQAKSQGADLFVYDADGMGAGLKRQAALAFDGTRTQVKEFRGGLSGAAMDNADDIYLRDDITEKKTYSQIAKNNRSRYYLDLAYRFKNTYDCVIKGKYVDPDLMISLDSSGIENIQQLRSEICRIPEKLNNPTGLFQIVSKQEMLKLGIKSPNLADSVMMTMISPKTKKKHKELKYKNLGIV